MKYAMIGAAGYIALKHMEAIKKTGGELIAAMDKNDSVGILDSYFLDCVFFTSFENFDQFVKEQKPDYLVVCTPNYIHTVHTKWGLQNGMNVICEKPLTLSTYDIDILKGVEYDSRKKVSTILQLRLHPKVIQLKNRIDSEKRIGKYNISLEYTTSRGDWYYQSWKNDKRKSGGIVANIGIHFFDMLTWIFGPQVGINTVSEFGTRFANGTIEFERARVNWKLSTLWDALPQHAREAGKRTYRSLKIDNEEFEFSDGFTELHVKSYEEILAGRGFGLEDTRASIEIISKSRTV